MCVYYQIKLYYFNPTLCIGVMRVNSENINLIPYISKK